MQKALNVNFYIQSYAAHYFVSVKCNRNRCYFYHVTHPKIAEHSKSSHERPSHSNRATPLINLNHPPYNPSQRKIASISPTHIQHLTQSQYMPSYMDTRTRPLLLLRSSLNVPYPNKKIMLKPPHNHPFLKEQMKILKQLMTNIQHAQINCL